MSQDTIYLLIGSGVGFASATIGALIDYLISRRRNNIGKRQLPGCMMLLTTGVLGFIGVVVTIAFYFLTGQIRPAVMAGIGVLGSFLVMFVAITLIWIHVYQPALQKNSGS